MSIAATGPGQDWSAIRRGLPVIRGSVYKSRLGRRPSKVTSRFGRITVAFAGINYLGVLIAAVAGFAFGSVWYGLLGKAWLAALGKTKEDMKPHPLPFILAFVCQLVMAWMLAGLIGHLGEITLGGAMVSAGFVWFGFVLTTMLVNHRFQSASWSLSLIDGGHWLGVLLVMGLVIGLFGA